MSLPDNSTNSEAEFHPSHDVDFNPSMKAYHGAQALSSELKKKAIRIRNHFMRQGDDYIFVEALEKESKMAGSDLYGVFVHNAVLAANEKLWEYFMDCRLFNETQWLGIVSHSQAKGEMGDFDFPMSLKTKHIATVKVRGIGIKLEFEDTGRENSVKRG